MKVTHWYSADRWIPSPLLSCLAPWQRWLEDWAYLELYPYGLCGLALDSLHGSSGLQEQFLRIGFLIQPQKSPSSTPPHSIGQNSHKYTEIQGMRAQTPPLYVRHAPNLQEASSILPESCSLWFPGTEKNPGQPTLCLTLGGFSWESAHPPNH